MNNRVAVIGAGMTRFMRRAKETGPEMCAAAVQMALEDAGLTIDDIDAVCLGTAPDAFDGVHMKAEYLLGGAGAANKPYLRNYVGGGTGVFAPIHGWMHVASGKFRTCLVVCEEKMSPCSPHPAGAFLTIFDHTTEQPLLPTLIHIFGIEMRRFMHVYGYTERDLAQVSAMCKRNALDHPAAQIAQECTVEDVLKSPVLSWPVKRMDISPTSDAAVALVLCNEHLARTHKKAPAFIDGVGFRLDTAYWCTRDLGFPNYVAMAAHDAYAMAGIADPIRDIDIFEPYDPFDYKALHHMNGLLLDRTGRRVKELLHSGNFERTGSHPMCPSGGLLGVGNPIAAAGLMKIAELYFQLTGQAGKRQVKKDAHRGVAQAWGDLMQVGTVVVMSSEGGMPITASRWPDVKPADLPGTPLKNVEDVEHVEYTPDLRYAWDNGQALTTYLEGFREGHIRGSKCHKCGRMMVPARSFCEICNLQVVDDCYDLADTGTVMTYTLSHVDWDSSFLPDGKVRTFAVIAIDGAAPEHGLLHHLGEVEPDKVHVGMRVKAVWKDPADRKGCVTDVKYFRPMAPGEDVPFTPVRIKPVEVNSRTAKAFPGKIPMSYKYTAGVGGSRFYKDLAEGRLSGTACPKCGAVLLPSASYCEDCMVTLDPDANARVIPADQGLVASYTTVFEDRSGHVLAKPVVAVQVVFPGTRGSLFGILEGDEEPEIGLNVRLLKAGKVTGPESVRFAPV
jgi:acetyl-CoA C-acetyltransferase